MPGTITALEIQKRNKERVNVYLDGDYSFSLTLIEAARLHRGQVLSDDDIAALQAQDAVEKAVDRAVRFLSFRPRSVQEIRRNLSQKGVAEPTVEAALARLEKLGYVDDEAFARFWVNNRDDFNPKGPRALRQELRQKGIANSIIDQALAAVDFTDAATRAVQRQVKRWQTLDQPAFKQKVYEFLARRGFLNETIKDVTTQLIEDLVIPDTDEFDYD